MIFGLIRGSLWLMIADIFSFDGDKFYSPIVIYAVINSDFGYLCPFDSLSVVCSLIFIVHL